MLPISRVLTATASAIALSLMLIGSIVQPAIADQPTADRPNVIVILSDDMGYSDIGCYGSEIKTPVLDKLASNGLRFTQFYNTGRCCPTRASLLTGLYPHQTGIGCMTSDEGKEGYRGELNRNCVTIAEALKPSGYATYCVGKWHVTRNMQSGDKSSWPRQRGFEKYYGIIAGATSFWDPHSLVRGNKPITHVNDPAYEPTEPYHFTDAVSDNAVSYINQHQSDKPFFMYVAYTAAHWPMHARERDIAKYEGKYDNGYKPIINARLKKMKQLGVIAADTKITNAVGNWDKVPDKEWESACMEVYAAMVDQMDQGIGQIVDALKAKGELDNTLIMFMQDNGGCAEKYGRSANPEDAVARADAPTLDPIANEDFRNFRPIPKQTRDGYPVRRGHVMPGPADTYITYGKNWANVSNTPLREYKHYVHEGGIATPLIVHWPAGFSARNELRSEPSHLIDIMATCLDVSTAQYPSMFKDQKIKPLQGKSLIPVFNNQPFEREALYWEHEGNRAVRVGDWKLVAKGQKADRYKPAKWELYNVVFDRNENKNLIDIKPDLANKLKKMWQDYAQSADVFPAPVTKKREKKKQSKPNQNKTKQNKPKKPVPSK